MGDHSTGTWTPISAGTYTGSGSTSARLSAPYRELNLYIRTTSVAGDSPVAVFRLEDSPENSYFYERESVSILSTGYDTLRVASNLGEYIRLSYEITGTFGIEVKGILKT